MPRRIPVTDLKVGMVILKETPSGGFTPDCHLSRKLSNGAPQSKTQLAFVTNAGQNVIWRPCGHVWVQ